ncbi:hypothetical protein ACLOJK_009253 [Asimina triloba]
MNSASEGRSNSYRWEMALKLLQSVGPSSPPLFQSLSILSNSRSPFSTRLLFPPPRPPTKTLVTLSHTQNPIFLPLLDLQEEEEEELDGEEPGNQVAEEDETDPLLQFFKSLAETPDPKRPGRLLLKEKRRTAWHLAPTRRSKTHHDSIHQVPDSSSLALDLGTGDDGSRQQAEEKGEGVIDEILRIAGNLPQNSTLGEFLDPFVGRIGEVECVTVLAMLGEEGSFSSCLYFYEWMRLQEPSLLTPRACPVMFSVLGRAGMGDRILVLFDNLPKQVEFRDVRVYNAAISGLSCCGRYDDAWKVYETMEMNNIMSDHVTCSILITCMRKSGSSAKDAWKFFEKMDSKGVKWALEVLGALIKSFCEEGLMKEALIIQSEMERRGVPSNTIIYNTLMDGYGTSNHIEEAEALFVEMKEKGLKPTRATFNILMDAYSRRMQPEIVEDLLWEMQGMGLEPNVTSYNCLISAYGRKRKESDKAADAFLRMRKVGIKPTAHSYTALIHAYSVDGWHEKAYHIFNNMKREGLKPSVETYTALLDAFRRAGDTQTLKDIWKSMMKDKIQGTKVTFNTLLDGFAKQGQYIEARDVMSEFASIGMQPAVLQYNMLMNAYARGGQHSKLPQLLKEMAILQLKPDSFTYLTIIYAYVRVRDFSRAFYYHKQMVKSRQVPDAKSYEKLRKILLEKAKTKNRRDRSAMLGIINSKLGLSKRRKGKKDELWKDRKNRSMRNKEKPLTSSSYQSSLAYGGILEAIPNQMSREDLPLEALWWVQQMKSWAGSPFSPIQMAEAQNLALSTRWGDPKQVPPNCPCIDDGSSAQEEVVSIYLAVLCAFEGISSGTGGWSLIDSFTTDLR